MVVLVGMPMSLEIDAKNRASTAVASIGCLDVCDPGERPLLFWPLVHQQPVSFVLHGRAGVPHTLAVVMLVNCVNN